MLTLTAPGHADVEAWIQGDDLTGDWGGTRTELGEHGVSIDLDYTTDVIAALTGERFAAYHGNVDLMLTLDSGKLGLWPGGTLFVYGQNVHGNGISERLGALMPVSNLEAPPFTQLSELWYEQRLFSERLRLRAGKQDANRDFAAPRFPGNFVHSSFGAPPTIPMPTFPAPGLGVLTYLEVAPWLELRAGGYDASPELESFGISSAFDGGPFLIASATTQHEVLGLSDAALYSAGAWYRARTPEAPSHTEGTYATADVLWSVGPGKNTLQTFVRAGWASPEESAITLYLGGGITYHALRGHDTVGLGGGHVRARDEADTTDLTESFLELFYKARLTPWFSIEPDLQLLFGPGGGERTVLVGDVRARLKL